MANSEVHPIEVSNTHPVYQLDEQTVIELVLRVCEGEQTTIEDLSIVLSDHQTVLTLNRHYLSHDYLTDVLSFPLNDPSTEAIVDGEIYVDLDTAHERFEEFDVSFEEEAMRYVVHGLLHLIGYLDHTPEQKSIMKDREDRYLASVK